MTVSFETVLKEIRRKNRKNRNQKKNKIEIRRKKKIESILFQIEREKTHKLFLHLQWKTTEKQRRNV